MEQTKNSADYLGLIADDLLELTEPDEDVFGGDLAHVMYAMQETVDQVDVVIHDFQQEAESHVMHKVNQVKFMTCFLENK